MHLDLDLNSDSFIYHPRHVFLLRTILLDQFISVIVTTSVILSLIGLFIWDKKQKKHAILRNFPIIGHARYVFEFIGVYLRQYLFATDREELPFNRAERSWVYRAAKNIDTTVGFGSTRPLNITGTVFFASAPFPPIATDKVAMKFVTVGPYCKYPFVSNHVFNISAMSYGSISGAAIRALGQGAKMAGCWLNTGEGGVSSYHLESGCDLVVQIGTAKYGVRDKNGLISDEHLQALAQHEAVKMFEIKLSQGAKPGKGGILPAVKVTEEIARIRGIPPHVDSISPNRHQDISNVQELLDAIEHIRIVSGKPVGCKFVLGSYEWLHELCIAIHRRGVIFAPDFITLDSADGGTGASPQGLMDYMGIPIQESLPHLVDILNQYNLRERIKVIASGKLITPAEVVWAFCAGADFVNCARGFMMALGCVQAMQCHKNTCPTGIATHNPRLQHGLVFEDKAQRVFHYANNMANEVAIICHSCGVEDPRLLERKHARIVTDTGFSASLDQIFPDKSPLPEYA